MKLLNQTRDFASRAVNLAKLSHIFYDDLAPPDDGAPGVAGVAGASLRRCIEVIRDLIIGYVSQTANGLIQVS